MTFEVRADAQRVRTRDLRRYAVAAGAVSIVLVPAVLAATSRWPAAVWALVQPAGIGAIIYVAGWILAISIGFALGRRVRRTAAALRLADPTIQVEYVRLAPGRTIVVLAPRSQGFTIWLDGAAGLERIDEVTGIESVALTSRRIGGVQLYALEVHGDGGGRIFSVGTRATWGLAGARRRVHERLARLLLGPSQGA